MYEGSDDGSPIMQSPTTPYDRPFVLQPKSMRNKTRKQQVNPISALNSYHTAEKMQPQEPYTKRLSDSGSWGEYFDRYLNTTSLNDQPTFAEGMVYSAGPQGNANYSPYAQKDYFTGPAHGSPFPTMTSDTVSTPNSPFRTHLMDYSSPENVYFPDSFPSHLNSYQHFE